MIVAGGVVAPVLLMLGLRRVPAASASLALNSEGPLTVILAVLFFGEHLGTQAVAGAFLVMLGAAALSFAPGAAAVSDLWGILAIAGACLGWALDNNLTQRLSLRDPLTLAQLKGLLGGGIALALAGSLGSQVPSVGSVFWGLAIGFISYGLSVLLAVHAMRLIGVARQAAFFGSAPAVGVLVSIVVLDERFGTRELVAVLLMMAGLGLLARERHSHRHAHEPLRHDHRHVHDEHHQHVHVPNHPPGEPHAHEHTHSALEHEHPHVSDLHHRHGSGSV